MSNHIIGDQVEGSKWISMVEQQKAELERIFANNNPFMQTWRQLSSDVSVHIFLQQGKASAIIYTGSSLYMESGFLELNSAAQGLGNLYKPSILRYNLQVQDYIDSIDAPLQGKVTLSGIDIKGEKLNDGSVSKAVGCITTLEEVTDRYNNTYTGGGFCDTEAMLRKKKCQALVPSSIFSGKLKLFVQALYGSKRSDYFCDWDKPFFKPIVNMDSGHALSGFSQSNTWLVTTSDYQYYLFRYRTIAIDYYPVKLTSEGNKLRKILLDTPLIPDQQRKLEAYIFSGATLASEAEGRVTLEVPEAMRTQGLALAELGWSWAADGLSGEIVCHREHPEGKKVYIASHYQIAITPLLQEEGSYTFTVAISLKSSTEWWPLQSQLNIIYPFYVVGDTTMQLPVSPKPYQDFLGQGLPIVDTSFSYSAPVYVFRGIDDSPQLVTASYTASIHIAAESLKPYPLEQGMTYESEAHTQPNVKGNFTIKAGVADAMTVSVHETTGPTTHKLITPRGDATYLGYKLYADATVIGLTNPPGDITSNIFTQDNTHWLTYLQSIGVLWSDNILTTGRSHDNGAGASVPTLYAVEFWWQYNDSETITKQSTGDEGCVFFEIPYDSVDSIFLGQYQLTVAQNKVITSTFQLPNPVANTGGIVHSFRVFEYYYDHNGVFVRLSNYTEQIPCRFGGPSFSEVEVYHSYTTEYATHKKIDYRDKLGNHDSIIDSHGDSPYREWHFDSPVLQPLLNSIDLSRTSYTGSQHAFTTAIKRFEYPSDSAIGWA